MTPLTPDDIERAARLMQDTIVSSEKVRDGLRDEEAVPFVEWGLARAKQLAARLAAAGQLATDEEQIADQGYALARLMTRVNWLVTYRHKKDAAWLTRTFQMVNQLSREVYGEEAPTFSDEEIAAWLAGQSARSNTELIGAMVARLTPSSATAPADPAPPPGSESLAPPLPGRPPALSSPPPGGTLSPAPPALPLPGRPPALSSPPPGGTLSPSSPAPAAPQPPATPPAPGETHE